MIQKISENIHGIAKAENAKSNAVRLKKDPHNLALLLLKTEVKKDKQKISKANASKMIWKLLSPLAKSMSKLELNIQSN